MKYRDLILLFVSIVFILTLAYALGVNNNLWFIPAAIFILLILTVYGLWIKK